MKNRNSGTATRNSGSDCPCCLRGLQSMRRVIIVVRLLKDGRRARHGTCRVTSLVTRADRPIRTVQDARHARALLSDLVIGAGGRRDTLDGAERLTVLCDRKVVPRPGVGRLKVKRTFVGG